MVQTKTNLFVADNSGAKKVQCIKVLGGTGRKNADVGDVIVVSIREALPDSKVKEGEVHKAVIVRKKKQTKRPDGSLIEFDTNAVVLINKQGDPIGSRIFGVIPRELRFRNFMKIISLAPEVF